MWSGAVPFAAFIIVGCSLLALSGGVLLPHWTLDVALFLAVSFLYPYLINRKQHISLVEQRASVQRAVNEMPGGGERTLRLLCYNLFMRPGLWFIRNNDSDHKDVRLAAFLAHLDSFDIIALQEMFGLLSLRQRTLLHAAAQRGFCHAAVAGAPPYLFWDRHWTFKIPFLDAGVVILSRHPIIETDSHYYSLGNQIDGWAPKQVLWALVQLPGPDNFVHVFNTHMQASYFDAPSNTSDMARAKQVNELATFVKSKVYGGGSRVYPAIVCGDFNLDARSKDGPHSLDYLRMMDVLQRELHSPEHGFVVRDLVYESHGAHPITYGDVVRDAHGRLQPSEIVLTHTADYLSQLSIDYVFLVGPPVGAAAASTVRHEGTKIEPFRCAPGEAEPCTHLSDHLGIVSTFTVLHGGGDADAFGANNSNNSTIVDGGPATPLLH